LEAIRLGAELSARLNLRSQTLERVAKRITDWLSAA